MSPETPSNQEPIRLDLQKPETKIPTLTPEEQKRFTDFLKAKERTEIIHLTHEELHELKQSIGTSTLEKFIQQQEQESTSSHELIGNIDWIPNSREMLTQIDNLSYSLLFWEKPIFKDSNLSEDAKRNFSTAFSLYIFENISQNAKIDVQNATLILKNFIKTWQVENTPQLSEEAQKFWNKISAILEWLRNIIKIDLDQKWENNAILMNPALWLNFLKNFTNSREAIKPLLDADESNITITEEQKTEVKWLSPKLKEALRGFNESKDRPDDMTLEKLKSDPTMLESLKTLADNKLFGPFFKFVLSLLGIGKLDEAIDGAYHGKIKEHFTKLTKEKNLIITDWKLWADFMMDGANKDTAFVSNLRKLHAKGKPDEAFLSALLKNGWELGSMINALNNWALLNSENIDYKVLSQWVNHLVWYKEWVKVKWNEWKNMHAYVVSLKEEKQTNTENTWWNKAPENSTIAKPDPIRTTTKIDDSIIKGNSLKLLKGEIIDWLSDIFKNWDYSDFKRIKIKDIQTTENIDLLLKNAIGWWTYIDGNEIEKSDYEELNQEVKDSLKNAIKTIKEYPNLKLTFNAWDWWERDLTIWKLIEDKDFKDYLSNV